MAAQPDGRILHEHQVEAHPRGIPSAATPGHQPAQNRAGEPGNLLGLRPGRVPGPRSDSEACGEDLSQLLDLWGLLPRISSSSMSSLWA